MSLWAEWRISKLVRSLVEATGSAATPDQWRRVLEERGQEEASLPEEQEELVRALREVSGRPRRVGELVRGLRAAGVAVVGPFLELVHWARLGPPPRGPRATLSLTQLHHRLVQAASPKKALALAATRGRPLSRISLPQVATYNDQESQLVDDLLSCLMGFNGVFIIADENLSGSSSSHSFAVSEAVDAKLRSIAGRILPLASCRSTIVRFVEENRIPSAGAVNQTLGLAMEGMVADLTARVAALEAVHRSQRLQVSRLWTELWPAADTLDTLAGLASSLIAAGARGAATLSLLHDAAHGRLPATSDPALCGRLLQGCCKPYLGYTSLWIFEGRLKDPYDEFMIASNASLDPRSPTYPDDYWRKGFILRENKVPKFLGDQVVKILHAGWYLDAVAKSEPFPESYPSHRLQPSLVYDEVELEGVIEDAYARANDRLLGTMTLAYDAVTRIERAKLFYVMERGDMFLNIIQHCEKELERPVTDICPVYLGSLLKSALESTMMGHVDDIGFELKRESLLTQLVVIDTAGEVKRQKPEILSGLEAFALTVTPPWPVSLMFNRKAVICCQLIFRTLFYNKYVEYCLVRVKGIWKKSLRAHALRHQMVTFVQAIHYYMTEDTIQVHWIAYLRKLDTAYSVDDMMKCFADFVHSSLSGCMLLEPRLAAAYRRVLELCLDYCKHLSIKLDPDVDHYKQLFTTLVSKFLIAAKAKEDSWASCAQLIFLRANYNNYYSISETGMDEDHSMSGTHT